MLSWLRKIGVAIAVLVIALFAIPFVLHWKNAPHRAALLRLYQAIPLGASPEEVLQKYQELRTDKLILHSGKSEWSIVTPSQGTDTWALIIEFAADGVWALRFRSSDGPRPPSAPEDKERQ